MVRVEDIQIWAGHIWHQVYPYFNENQSLLSYYREQIHTQIPYTFLMEVMDIMKKTVKRIKHILIYK
jgi:hypothetical protein